MAANHKSPLRPSRMRPIREYFPVIGDAFCAVAACAQVGAVERIGPHQEKHTDNIDGQTVEIKANACTDTEKDGGHSNGVGRDSEPACQQRPPVAERTIKMQIEPLFGIH